MHARGSRSAGASNPMPTLFLVGILVFSLAACRSERTLDPEEVLQRSTRASAALPTVSYAMRAAHTAENGDRTDVLLEGGLRRDAQQHHWRIRVERNGALIGSASGASIEPDDPYLLPLPATFLKVARNRGMTQWNNRTAYMYDVVLRDEAGDLFDALADRPLPFPALRFTGTLWIDAESFLPLRSTWDVTSRGGEEKMTLDIAAMRDATLIPTPPISAHDQPPTRDQASIERIFDAIPPSLSLLLGRPKEAEEVP